MTAVSLTNVSLVVGGATVLSKITLAVAEGEFVGVLGANGAGKTTLLRAISGVVVRREGASPHPLRAVGAHVYAGLGPGGCACSHEGLDDLAHGRRAADNGRVGRPGSRVGAGHGERT